MEYDRRPLEQRFKELEIDRQIFVPVWKDLKTYIYPPRGIFDTFPSRTVAIDHKKLVDGEPMEAASTLASGMLSGMSSPASPWFIMGTLDPDLNDYRPAKAWLELGQEIVQSIFAKSRVYMPLYDLYQEQGVFASSCMLIMPDYENVIRAHTLTCGEYFLATDENGRINTFGRIFTNTVESVVRKFGKENVSKETRERFDGNHLYEPVVIYHIIEPNDGRDPTKRDKYNMPYRSVYWEQTQEPGHVLRVGGYKRFPVLAPRWGPRTRFEAYGVGSPGWKALGDSKSLQVEAKDKMGGVAKIVNPPVQVPGSMKTEIVNGLPGGKTYVPDMDHDRYVRPLYDVKLPLEHLRADIQDLRDKINRYFYTDLFRLLQQRERPEKTAYEVAILHEEKVMVLSPVIESNQEMLDQLIELTFQIALDNGIIPEPSPELARLGLRPDRIDYISALSQAQKMVGVTGLIDTLNLGLTVSATHPEVLDNIDLDAAINEYGSRTGAPAKMMRSEEAVIQLRRRRAEEQAAQQQMAVAAAAIDAAKNLSQASLEKPSALSAILGGARGGM